MEGGGRATYPPPKFLKRLDLAHSVRDGKRIFSERLPGANHRDAQTAKGGRYESKRQLQIPPRPKTEGFVGMTIAGRRLRRNGVR